MASSFGQASIIYEDVLSYARGLGHDLADRSLWRLARQCEPSSAGIPTDGGAGKVYWF